MIARVQKEYKSYLQYKEKMGDKADYSINLDNDNDLSKMNIKFKGPANSPYENGIFKLFIEIPKEYPFHPPKVTFKTKIIHPNISPETGYICLDILKEKSEYNQSGWSPIQNIDKIILSLISLLNDPNPDSPLNGEAAVLYKDNRNEYNLKVISFVEMYASSDKL